MVFALDFQDIHSKLFLLEQLIHGSWPYCYSTRDSQNIGGSGDVSWGWLLYTRHLETEVGNYLIECAIKTRMLQDLINKSGRADAFYLDNTASEHLGLGKFDDGSELRGIRDSCNRIVHATTASLIWTSASDEAGIEFEYWGGMLRLSGEQNAIEWNLSLNVFEWCLAMRSFYDLVDDAVDWMSLWEQ